jgi:O-antigen ligase
MPQFEFKSAHMTNPPRRSGQLRPRDVHLYTVCDQGTAALVYLMVIFSPWAFGTTQPWAIWVMNAAGYVLGVLLLVKLFIRLVKGYHPPRWGNPAPSSETRPARANFPSPAQLKGTLILLTVSILLFCLVSALNAAASHDHQALNFAYHPYIRWLPHSFDSGRTWLVFWNYLALSCAFWAITDWLPGKSGGEERAARQKTGAGYVAAPTFPTRLRRLLWVLCLNGALVGLEGIVQRLEGTGRLLFLIKPVINAEAIAQFGPYHYRANASTFFNLVWPVCLGFWWTLHRSASSRVKKHHLLLVCGIIMAACPIISTSRGGALITCTIILFAAFFFCATHFLLAARRQQQEQKSRFTMAFLIFFFAGTLALGSTLGWKALRPRMEQIQEGFEGREEMYAAAKPMAKDYPLFGTGPGTFESVFQLYRISTETYWPAQLHNDWLETRITFGMVGSLLIVAALVSVFLRWFARGGLHSGRRFILMIWLALGGCLAHARFDFPFQIYSLLFLFLVLCAIVFNLSRRG